jgi:hypothetical protein
MRTFHEFIGPQQPIRLSYHGASHYNAIVPLDWNYEKVFVTTEPGAFEEKAI